jgi:hypothetical protein
MIALDTNALSLLFLPTARISQRGSNKPIKFAKERIEELIRALSQSGEKILVPTPVLSELLVKGQPKTFKAW